MTIRVTSRGTMAPPLDLGVFGRQRSSSVNPVPLRRPGNGL